MSVKIDVELTAGDAEGEILGIAGALETLQKAGGNLDDINLDFDGVDIDEISNMADELEDISEQLDGIFSDFDGSEKSIIDGDTLKSDVKEAINEGIEESDSDLIGGAGSTGGGGSSGNDPPSSSKSSDGDSEFDRAQFKKKLADLIGIDDSDVSLTGDFDPKRLGKDGGSILPSLRGLTSDEYPHVTDDSYPNLPNVPDSLFGVQDPSEMEWGELQKAAGDAGVYTRPRDVPDSVKAQDDYSFRDYIERKFKTSQPGTGGIQIDTAQGKKNLREAMQTMQTPLTDSGAIDDSGSMRKAFAEDIAEQRGYDSLRDLAAADRRFQSAQRKNNLHEQAKLEKKSRDLRDRYNERRNLEEERDKAQQRVEIAETHEEARSIRERAATREQIADDHQKAFGEKKLQEAKDRFKARRELEKERDKAQQRVEIAEIHEKARSIRERASTREQIADDHQKAFGEKQLQEAKDRFKARRELEKEREAARKRVQIAEIHEKARSIRERASTREQIADDHQNAFGEKQLQEAKDRFKARRELEKEREAARKRVQIDRDHSEALRQKKGRDLFKPRNIKRRLANLGSSSSGIAKRMRKLVPSIGMIYNAIAALLPVLVAVGSQLVGVAAAMGGVAVAGAAIMGLGLLGHGDSMAESFREAKLQVRDLKKEMFEVAQPTMQEFAPIQERMFEAIPGGTEGIFSEMQGLTQFEGTLFNLGGMASDGIERFFAIINNNSEAISQLSERFGQLTGSKLLDFFEFMIQAAFRNQELIVKLGSVLMSLVEIVYNLVLVAGRVVSAFTPVMNLLGNLSFLLNNKIIVGILSAITAMALFAVGFGKTAVAAWTLANAIGSVLTMLGILSSSSLLGGVGAFFTTLSIYTEAAIAHFMAMSAAAKAAAVSIGLLTLGTTLAVGAVAAGGAMSAMDNPDSSQRGGGGGTYVDNRSYEVNTGSDDDYASLKGMEDAINRSKAREDAQMRPNVETSATDR